MKGGGDIFKSPLYDALKKYQNEGLLRLHMPGHTGQKGFKAPELKAVAAIDVTEVPGLDDLHLPTGVIRQALDMLAQAYGAAESFFLVNGATSGIHTLFLSLAEPGGKVLLPRNAHRSFFGGMVLSGAEPVYIPGHLDEDSGVVLTVKCSEVQEQLQKNPDTQAVFLLSPSYYGTTSNVKEIAAECRRLGKALFIDEAHGGHFYFNNKYPQPALRAGADAVVNGVHKTLAVLNQGACLHAGPRCQLIDRIRFAWDILTTTSPSYPLMASLDLARCFMQQEGEFYLEKAFMLSIEYKEKINRLKGLEALRPQKYYNGNMEIDPLKLLITLKGLSINGFEVAHLLRSRFKIQVEMADSRNILAMMSIFHEKEEWERFYHALKIISSEYFGSQKAENVLLPPLPKVKLKPREAFFAKHRYVPLEESKGQISAETVAVYPPGIPGLLPGELISEEVYDYLVYVKNSRRHIQGPGSPELEQVKVIDG